MERLIGKQAPYFSMEALSADGEHFVRVALPDYAGKWLVLFFYPMDFTFVCPTELTAFSEHRETFRAAGAELLSVSTDSVYTHQAWQRNGLGGLGYPMAADQTLRVCADYGVLLEEEGVALRGLFLIDPEQKVRYSVIHDNNIGRNPEEVLRVLAALKTGGLCAAGWKAGEENLRPDMAERDAPVLAGTAPVRIYTMPGCSYCRSVKAVSYTHLVPGWIWVPPTLCWRWWMNRTGRWPGPLIPPQWCGMASWWTIWGRFGRSHI